MRANRFTAMPRKVLNYSGVIFFLKIVNEAAIQAEMGRSFHHEGTIESKLLAGNFKEATGCHSYPEALTVSKN